MSTIQTFLLISLVLNVMLAWTAYTILTMYLHARQWRDEWRDAHVDLVRQMRDVMREEGRE